MTTNSTVLTFDAAVKHLERLGWIIDLVCIDREQNVYLATADGKGWQTCALELARLIPAGIFTVAGTGERASLRWGMGRNLGGLIISHKQFERVKWARQINREVMGLTMYEPKDVLVFEEKTGRKWEPTPWTVGGCTRQLLKWAVSPQSPETNMETLRYRTDEGNSRYQYHDCKPGIYDNLTQWDGSAYFYTFMKKMPSPHVSLTPRGLHWGTLSPDEWHRWHDLLDALGADTDASKVVRNAVWGSALGGTHLVKKGKQKGEQKPGGMCKGYTSAKPKKLKEWEEKTGKKWEPGTLRVCWYCLGPGPLRPMAIVVARTGAELCSIASAEVDSLYSTVDSVTTTTGKRPAIWDRYKLPYKEKAQGQGHIVACGVWRIGAKATKPYSKAMTLLLGNANYGSQALIDKAPFFHPSTPIYVERHSFDTNYHTLWL